MINNYEKFPLKKITLMDALRLIESAAIVLTEEGSNTIIFEGGGYELIESGNEELLSRVINNIDCKYSIEYDIVISIELAVVVNNMEFDRYKAYPTVKDIVRVSTGDEIIEVRYRDQQMMDEPELRIVIDAEQPNDPIRNNIVIGNIELLDSPIRENSLWTHFEVEDKDDEGMVKILLWVDRT